MPDKEDNKPKRIIQNKTALPKSPSVFVTTPSVPARPSLVKPVVPIKAVSPKPLIRKKPTRPVATPVPAPLPPPPPPAPVEPPKAPRHWWVYFISGVFITATLGVIGWAVIGKPFAAVPVATPSNSTPPDTSVETTTPSTPSVYSYASVVNSVDLAATYTGTPADCPTADAPAVEVTAPTTSAKTNFVLAIASANSYQSGADFDLDLTRLNAFVDLADKHHLKSTLYLSSDFVTTATSLHTDGVAAWAKAGHEMAMSFNPAASLHLTAESQPSSVPYGSWLGTVHEEQAALESLCDCQVTSMSGGAQYDRMYEVAKDLGLTTSTGWINADGTAPSELTVVNPWIPKMSGDLTAMQTFDPFGSVVYLPNGLHPTACPKTPAPFTENTFTYLTKSLYASQTAAALDRINIFRVLIGSEDFGDASDDALEFDAWNEWLDSVVDPQMKFNKLVSVTDAGASAVFIDWLDQNIGKIQLK